MPTRKPETTEINIDSLTINRGEVTLCLLGSSPLCFNRVAEKAKRELLLPRARRMTVAEKAQNLKHDPFAEYRNSVYRRGEYETGPTRLQFPAVAFKAAAAQAALDIPGVAKTQMERLTWVQGDRVDIFGVPTLWMEVVRSADQNRTPDIRTRAVLPQWATMLSIAYVQPMLTGNTVAKMVSAAGLIAGVGDYRQGKGRGNFGQFVVVDHDDEQWRELVETGGIAAQDAALIEPTFFNAESEELLLWYNQEVKRRSDEPAPARIGRRRRDGPELAVVPSLVANGPEGSGRQDNV
jgi:hypothetical protein